MLKTHVYNFYNKKKTRKYIYKGLFGPFALLFFDRPEFRRSCSIYPFLFTLRLSLSSRRRGGNVLAREPNFGQVCHRASRARHRV